jgi:hypothetical protein
MRIEFVSFNDGQSEMTGSADWMDGRLETIGDGTSLSYMGLTST